MKLSMFKSILTFSLLMVFSIQMAQSQALGAWRPYMAYQDATMIEVANGYVYAVYKGNGSLLDGSLLRYKPASGNALSETKLISKVDGLNDVSIVQMAYVEAEKTLVLVYDNGNIDLYDTSNGNVYNLADFMNRNNVDKIINGIDVHGSSAYISVNFGVLAIDAKNKVQKNTYNIGRKTYSVCIWGDFVYAATDGGIFRAKETGNLLTAANWEPYTLSYPGNPSAIRKILTYKNNFVFYQPNVGVFYQNSPNGTVTRVLNTPVYVNQMTILDNQLVMITNSSMYTCSDLSLGATSTAFSASNDISPVRISFANNSTYWLACGLSGIRSFDKNSGDISAPITINSPKRNLAFNMTFTQGKLAVVGGGRRDRDPPYFNNPGTLMVMEADGTWINADERALLTAAQNDPESGSPYINDYDYFNVVIDPRDKNHYFVSLTRSGVYELRSDYNQKSIDYVKLYNHKNTNGALKSIYPDAENAAGYVRTAGLAYDNKNNLYVMNGHSAIPICVYSADNKWFDVYNKNVQGSVFPLQVYITKANQKWIVFDRGSSAYKGVLVLNDRGTIDDPSDDISFFSNSFSDQDGEKIDIVFFSCVAEDLNGTVWVGTSNGPIIFDNPLKITEPNSAGFNSCYRAKVPRNDGTNLADFLLEGVGINTIAVDGANRKWIGTVGAGVFLVSPTGDKVIANYTTDNSPLLSNTINNIVINHKTGEVFIATIKGLISYTGLATEGAPDYSNVYAYPNPVLPDFIGDVVVTGLIKDSNVKVTDLSGNVMFQGTSTGGQFSWNCRNRAGERVKSGVYLVMAATSDGTQGVVTKIVVVK
ncbi:MAG: hypothetical protein LBI82_10715 [Dysgonamonadaceae bacterium]|nr:hypothetical protein [Dysgonamonadaceae bacterium]